LICVIDELSHKQFHFLRLGLLRGITIYALTVGERFAPRFPQRNHQIKTQMNTNVFQFILLQLNLILTLSVNRLT
jgi:hypothetical protein